VSSFVFVFVFVLSSLFHQWSDFVPNSAVCAIFNTYIVLYSDDDDGDDVLLLPAGQLFIFKLLFSNFSRAQEESIEICTVLPRSNSTGTTNACKNENDMGFRHQIIT
jgi:hypothetical protein